MYSPQYYDHDTIFKDIYASGKFTRVDAVSVLPALQPVASRSAAETFATLQVRI